MLAENSQEIQEPTEASGTLTTPTGNEEQVTISLPVIMKNGKQEKNIFLRVLKLPAVSVKIQQVFDINPKIYYELVDQGIIPREGTYEEILSKLFSHFRQKNDAYLRKVELNAEAGTTKGIRSVKSADTESGLPRIVESDIVQKIKLNKAKEQEIHIRNCAARNLLIDKAYLNELLLPLIGNIANILRNAADDNPDLVPSVDKCFNTLYIMAQRLMEQAKEDAESYVKDMMEQEIDFDEMIAMAKLEL